MHPLFILCVEWLPAERDSVYIIVSLAGTEKLRARVPCSAIQEIAFSKILLQISIGISG